MTAEQKARDMLERIGVENAQSFSAGELVELANLIAKSDRQVAMIENKLERKFDPAGWQWLDKHGQVFQIEDLTRDDLLQVVCDCMTALEEAEEACATLQEVFDSWANWRIRFNDNDTINRNPR